MLLDKYDFYDIHSVLARIRLKPDASYNVEIVKAVYEILSAPQKDDTIDANIIRKGLRDIRDIDEELFHWVYIDNVYTYGWKIIKDDFCYSFLAKGFLKMIACAESGELKQLEDLADALHNIPIFFADGCKFFKKATKVQFDYYNKRYQTNLWKELAN